jgi:alpha-D-ribose 1-methylphosphonate 5-triphosphate synthase subunit PhnH
MSLLTGFTQPIDQSQQTFRLILKALSEPGHVVTLQGSPTWDRLNAASTAALLTLADQETPIQLSPELKCSSNCAARIMRFHTGAVLASANRSEATFRPVR